MRRARLGRIIGTTGGVVAAGLWGFLLFGCLAWLIDPPHGLERLAILGILPLAVIAAPIFVVSVGDVIVLARRVDTTMPWRVGSVHLVLALILGYRHAWLPALGLFAISASQLLAIRLFQLTPSHALSQR